MLLAGGILLANKKTKEFYIDLQDNRYYNPGETIRGILIESLKSLAEKQQQHFNNNT